MLEEATAREWGLRTGWGWPGGHPGSLQCCDSRRGGDGCPGDVTQPLLFWCLLPLLPAHLSPPPPSPPATISPICLLAWRVCLLFSQQKEEPQREQGAKYSAETGRLIPASTGALGRRSSRQGQRNSPSNRDGGVLTSVLQDQELLVRPWEGQGLRPYRGPGLRAETRVVLLPGSQQSQQGLINGCEVWPLPGMLAAKTVRLKNPRSGSQEPEF